MSVEKKIDKMADLVEAVRLLGRLHPMVGIPQSEDERDDGEEISNAELLYIHDQGAPEVGIPQREVMAPGVESEQTEINRRLRLAGEAALDGRPQSVRNQMQAAGMAGARGIKRMINSNVQPPLAPATIAARRRAGVKSERTLVRTGQMRNAVTSVVREE